ncbi:HD domain-containing protein [Patescibacteria group bacterium]|nr:HD domain-containing protein [Patescibacteria group bacterium]
MLIPSEVKFVIEQLKNQGFDAYIVGGCVRDILRGAEPEDWDIATNAEPEEIGKIFLKSFSNNKFGTVTVLIEKSKKSFPKIFSENSEEQESQPEPEYMEIEITPFRTEEKYTDKRHPDEVKWAKTIEQDLARRDFTVNAMAIDVELQIANCKLQIANKSQKNSKLQIPKNKKGTLFIEHGNFKIIDPFGGQKNLENKIIKAVGEPENRFNEDALRIMRAIRFAVCLDAKIWTIEEKTEQAIQKNAGLLSYVSQERIRDELLKIIKSQNGAKGIEILRKKNLLHYIIPELEQGFNNTQNKHHIYQIYQHSLLSLNFACQKKFSMATRFAALLHDVGKPRVKQGEGLDSTFYNHEVVGAKITEQILSRLKFPKKDSDKIVKLVRYHLFYYNVDEVGDSSVRRLLKKVGKENILELLKVRQADRIGSGVPKAEPYKLRHLKYLFEKVSQDPISPHMLKVSGNDVMTILKISPGPKVGQILSCLLDQVLIDPEKNDQEFLEKEIECLGKMSEQELKKLTESSKKEIEKIETKRDEMTKEKYWVT